jgi:hypothetical protein
MTSGSHHSQTQPDRKNHSSPSKVPGSSGIGSANGTNMAGSTQAGSIQQGPVGGISGVGARPAMNQTGHGKSFPYSSHRKTNSNKLPHISSSSNSKDPAAQSA